MLMGLIFFGPHQNIPSFLSLPLSPSTTGALMRCRKVITNNKRLFISLYNQTPIWTHNKPLQIKHPIRQLLDIQ
jgi:hypothetical protein